MDGTEQGLDIFITLILFQECLASRRIQDEHPVRKMTQINVPWELLKVNGVPSLRMGKAECGS